MLETGDLLLFHGEGWISTLLEYIGHSKYSHVGMIVRNPKFLNPSLEDGLYVLDSSWGCGPDSEDHQLKFGVQLHKLSDILALYPTHTIYSRHVTAVRDDAFYEKFKAIHEVIHNKPYNLSLYDWIHAKENLDHPYSVSILWKHTERFWCSALASYVYYKLGWASDLNWDLVAPREFSSKEATGQVVFTCTLSDEQPIERFLYEDDPSADQA